MSAVDFGLLKVLFERTRGRVRYELGAKPRLGADSREVVVADCSGYIRWLLDRCGVRLPDGSQQQWAYVRDVLKWKAVPYDQLGANRAEGPLWIAFKPASKDARGHVRHGHVWLVVSERGETPWTIECYTRVGVGSRPWRALKPVAAACYVVPIRR